MKRVRVWIAGLMLAKSGIAWGAPVRFFVWNSAASHANARLEGVSVSREGILELAPRLERRGELGAVWVYAVVPTEKGWAVATGDPGQVWFLDREGQVIRSLPIPDAHALSLEAEPNGSLLVGTAPGGKLLRLRGEKVEVVFETGATYVWAVRRSPVDGAVWVATGNPGRVYRLRGGGPPELVFEAGDVHLRALALGPDGSLFWGTSPSGRIQRWLPREGRVQTVFDSDLEEVVGIAVLEGGGLVAALNGGESPMPEPGAASSKPSETMSSNELVPVVTVEVSPPMLVPSAGKPAPVAVRSELVELLPNGGFRSVWSSSEETVHVLFPERNRIWMGTGRNGRVYQLVEGSVRRVSDLRDRVVVGFAQVERRLAVVTLEGSALWLQGPTGNEEWSGVYESDIVDAGQPSKFGEFRWQGELPKGSRLRVAARSGWSREVDSSWSPWSEWQWVGEGRVVITPPVGRFAQLRLELTGFAGSSPRVVAFDWAYRQQNLPPQLERVQVLDPGQVLVSASFNPADQVFEPVSPNRDGIFTTLEPAMPRDERYKTLWRRGWRTVRWKASDPNQDELRATVKVRRESPGETPGPWLEIGSDLALDFVSFDSTVLPEGWYRFQVQVRDARTSGPGEALEGEATSELVLVDHSPPQLKKLEVNGSKLRVEVADRWSSLRELAVSLDGKPWEPVVPEDGLVDGLVENLSIELPKGTQTALLRVGDSSFNYVSFDLLQAQQKP